MSLLKLIVLLTVRTVASVPVLLARQAGFCYKGEFEIGGKIIKRPEHWIDNAHKAAFENVGQYITDAVTRDVMESYTDADLSRESFLKPSNVSLETWHEVLEFFEEYGFIVSRWRLMLPSTLTKPSYAGDDWYPEKYASPPSHGPNGESLDRPQVSGITGVVPDSAEFTPSLLKPSQKEELLGKPYRLHAQGAWVQADVDAEESVVVEEKHFVKVYFRPRWILSEKNIEDGNQLLRKVFSK